MKHTASYIIILLLLTTFTSSMARADGFPHKELRELNKVMEESKKYEAIRRNYIDSLLNVVEHLRKDDAVTRSLIYMDIGNAYCTYMADSALNYYTLAKNIADKTSDIQLQQRTRIGMVMGLSASGLFSEANIQLDELEKEPMSIRLKIEMWLAARRLYSGLWTYVQDNTYYEQKYKQKYIQYDDSLLNHLDNSSPEYKFIYAERLVEKKKYEQARQILEKILQNTPTESNLHGMAAFQMAQVYQNQGDEYSYARYLIMASISDIKGCVNEGWALPMLSEWLYKKGKFDQAFIYINHSLADALAGNARNRPTMIAKMLPNIDTAYRADLNRSRTLLTIFLCVASFLFLISAILVIILIRQNSRSHNVQQRLSELSRLQDSYIGTFVGLCSSYSAKLTSWQKLVARKISSGQSDDLLKTIKNGKLSDENEDFHNIIDNTFLRLYPDFIEQVNALLRPEEQIKVRKEGVMPPELRIYALLRLGVSESTRIASILQYSTNTVYTYRNKMRNKAINRDTFEDDIMNIGHDL